MSFFTIVKWRKFFRIFTFPSTLSETSNTILQIVHENTVHWWKHGKWFTSIQLSQWAMTVYNEQILESYTGNTWGADMAACLPQHACSSRVHYNQLKLLHWPRNPVDLAPWMWQSKVLITGQDSAVEALLRLRHTCLHSGNHTSHRHAGRPSSWKTGYCRSHEVLRVLYISANHRDMLKLYVSLHSSFTLYVSVFYFMLCQHWFKSG